MHHGAPGDVAAIYKFIANGSFGPDEIEVVKAAFFFFFFFPITELIAKAIVNVTVSGERNPKKVMERALNALGVRRSFFFMHHLLSGAI